MSILDLTLTVYWRVYVVSVRSMCVCVKTPPGINNVKMFASSIYHTIALYEKTAIEYSSNVFH